MESAGDTVRRFDEMFYQAAGLSVAAGLVHVFASFTYWEEWWGYGTFFLLLALLQVTYGIVLFMRPWHYERSGDARVGGEGRARARSFLALGAVATAAIVALWLFAHLIAVPFGPHAGQREPITFLSVVALIVMAAQAGYLTHLIREIDKGYAGAGAYVKEVDAPCED